MQKIIKNSIAILALVVLVYAVSVSANWGAPTAVPPNGNTTAPINVGYELQSKLGPLVVGAFRSLGAAIFDDTLTTVGSVGVGTPTPSAKLEVAGQVKITGGTPGANKVLASDAMGLASWKTLAELGGGGSGGGNVGNGGTGGWANYVTKWIDGTTIGNSQIFDNGTNVGIGMSAPTAKLQVNGQVKITGGNPGQNKILASDQSGLASWKTPTEIGIGGNQGGGGGSAFSTSFNILSCTIPVSAGTLNTSNGIYGWHFTIPPSMNGWKFSNFIVSPCDGDGDITVASQIKRANGTIQSMPSVTATAWNQPGEWTGGQTVNTGDRIKVGSWTNVGELSGLTISIVIKP